MATCRIRWLLCTVVVGRCLASLTSPLLAEDLPYGRHEFDESTRQHWSFLPVRRPEVPQVSRQDWPANPVDRFVLKQLEASGLEPAPQADKRALLRRVYLDLIGLPPTPDEQQQFVADQSADAYAKVVDGLLSRPEYGERWARHWLDVVRYAETNGYERDNDKPSVWRYRDYVINSLNADKPYDRFVTEQLAGDEIEGTSAETQIATTYLRLGPWDDEPADPLVDRYDQLDDIVGNTSASLIGMTIRCARCHDHKFEPFTQRDYTRWLANFEPLKRPQTGRDDLDREVGTDAELAAARRREQALAAASDELNEFESGVIRQAQAENRLGSAGDLPSDVITALATAPKERTDAQRKQIQNQSKQITELITAIAAGDDASRLHQLRENLRQLNEKLQPAPRAYVFYEEGPQCGPSHLLKRGDPRSQAEAVGPGVPAVLVDAILELIANTRAGERTRLLPTVRELTGKPGRTFAEWARENRAAFL
jgi:hypothetical protein